MERVVLEAQGVLVEPELSERQEQQDLKENRALMVYLAHLV